MTRQIIILEKYSRAQMLYQDLCDELSDCGFLRCHRSYMVNFQHVHVMRSDGFFVLDDQQMCIRDRYVLVQYIHHLL